MLTYQLTDSVEAEKAANPDLSGKCCLTLTSAQITGGPDGPSSHSYVVGLLNALQK